MPVCLCGQFSRPVYVGSEVTARVEVTRIRARDTTPPSLIVFCGTHTMDEQGVTAIAGEAVVLINNPPPQQEEADEDDEEGGKGKGRE